MRNIAQKIADSLSLKNYNNVLEIGPGMGVLTKYLLDKKVTTHVIEIDKESVAYLKSNFLTLANRVIEEDFLKYDLKCVFNDQPFAIIGNYPYNISSQIVFKTLEMRDQVPEFSGMFQKEVAQRICEKKKALNPTEYFLFWYKRSMMLNIFLLFPLMFLIRLLK